MRKSTLIAFFFTIVLFSCDKAKETPIEETPKVSSLKILTPPTNTTYYENNKTLDLTGLEVLVYYTDLSKDTVSFDEFESFGITCSPANGRMLELGLTTVTVTHLGTNNSNSFTISTLGLRTIAIELKQPPLKTDYYLGETLDLTGLQIDIVKNSGEKTTVSYDDFKTQNLICSLPHGIRISAETPVTVALKNSSSTLTLPIKYAKKLTDIDGNQYQLCKIGEQIWMAENLRTTKLNDGNEIVFAKDVSKEVSTNNPSYCWAVFTKEFAISDQRGALYNFKAVQSQDLCPDGYHVPTPSEWQAMIKYIGENGYLGNEATALKKKNKWSCYIENNGFDTAFDTFSFGAVPTGWNFENTNGYTKIDFSTAYWMNGNINNSLTMVSIIECFSQTIITKELNINCRLPVRCVKD